MKPLFQPFYCVILFIRCEFMVQLVYPSKKGISDIIASAHQNPALSVPVDMEQPVLFGGDNFVALSSLIQSGYEGKIDLVYIDPPYNTNQIFTVETDRTSTISRSKNGDTAYRDDMPVEDYLEFMRERLVLIRELLSEQGSLYLHIDQKMGHYLKILLDEIFGLANFKNDIARIKSNPKNFGRRAFGNQKDMVLFYAKNGKKNIFNQITYPLDDDEKQAMFQKTEADGRRYNTVPVHAPGETVNGETGSEWRGMLPPKGRHWRSTPAELDILDRQGLIEWSKNGVPRIKKYADEHKGKKIQDFWTYKDPMYPQYPTEKNADMLEMIIRQSSHPDSIVMDCFAGSGSTLLAAQRLQRRWIGSDISSAAIDTIRRRLGLMPYQYINLPSF